MNLPNQPLGKLIGVGVGPGAADLMTVRAHGVVSGARVIAYMHATGKPPLALGLVDGLLRDDAQHISIAVPMGLTRSQRRACYQAALPTFRHHLDAGRDVVFICEGDALFYGSFQYVMEGLSDAYAVEVIPGVTSIQACSAVAQLGLTRDDDTLHVLPATLAEEILNARAQDASATLAIMKLGRHLDKVKRVLARAGRLDQAQWIERAAQDGEKVCALRDAPEEVSYFSLVLSPAQALQPVGDVPEGAVVLCLNAAGLAAAKGAAKALRGAQLWGRKDRIDEAEVDQEFDDTAATLRALYQDGRPIVAVMSAGIVMRCLAPLLADKRQEPPVLAVSADGGFAVPLLGGHRGANRMAKALAMTTHGFAAITTAGDTALGVALDEPPKGWTVANPERAKDVAAKLLNGEPVGLQVDSGDAAWLTSAGFTPGAEVGVHITHRAVDIPDTLTLHPPVLVLGVGCERNCPTDHLFELVQDTFSRHGLSLDAVGVVVSIDVKADEVAVLELAERLNVPARFFSAAELNSVADQLKNPSDVVLAEVGCPGVAEGAALFASQGALPATLIVEKTKTKHATCAVALSQGEFAL